MPQAQAHARPESLWRLAWPVGVWAGHFFLVYGAAALACGRWAAHPEAPSPATLIIAVTVAAFAGLAGCLAAGARGRPVLTPAAALDDDHPSGRATFVATTNALLVLVSAIAVAAVGAAALLVPVCR